MATFEGILLLEDTFVDGIKTFQNVALLEDTFVDGIKTFQNVALLEDTFVDGIKPFDNNALLEDTSVAGVASFENNVLLEDTSVNLTFPLTLVNDSYTIPNNITSNLDILNNDVLQFNRLNPGNLGSSITLAVDELTISETDGTSGTGAASLDAQRVGKYYFEIEILVASSQSGIAISSIFNAPLSVYTTGYAYQSSGLYFELTAPGIPYGDTFGVGDFIGCAVDFAADTIEFFKNGVSQGVIATTLPTAEYRAIVESQGPGSSVKINLGEDPFAFPQAGFDGWTKQIRITTQPLHGTLVLNNDRVSIDFTPTPGYAGSDLFRYDIDGNGEPADVDLTIESSIVLNDDSGIVVAFQVLKNIDVLTNDTGLIGGETLTIETQALNGNAVVNVDGVTIDYTPNPAFFGNDSFTYDVDASGLPATVTLSVSAPVIPIPVADIISTLFETPVNIPVLVNDLNISGDEIITITTQATHGIATVDMNGTSINYTPDALYRGTDTFFYDVDNSGFPAVVNVTIKPVALNDDFVIVPFNTPVNIDVFANDTGLLGGETLNIITHPTNGIANVNVDGITIDYTPTNGYIGPDFIVYDVDGENINALITLDVKGPPVLTLVDDNITTAYNTPVNIPILTNDLNRTGSEILTITQPSNGITAINVDGVTVDYTPNAGFDGTDIFTYDLDNSGNPATVNVIVRPEYVIVNETVSTNQDTPISTNVLSNDTFPAGGTLSIVGSPTNGTATLNPDGVSIDYEPNPGFVGNDTVTYDINNSGNTGVLTIQVVFVNTTIVLNNDNVTTPFNLQINIDVLSNDLNLIGGEQITIVNGPSNGIAFVNFSGTSIEYIPNTDFIGTDAFTYDVDNTTNPATVTVTVDPPTGLTLINDNVNTLFETSVNIPVLNNDQFLVGGETVSIETTTSNGISVVNVDGVTIDYTPNPGFSGVDTLVYSVSGSSETAVVTINVAAEQELIDDVVTTDVNTPVNIAILSNDISLEPPGFVTINSQPLNGFILLENDKTVTYTPNSGFTGNDSFTYDVNSSGSPATVNITINTVLSPPEQYSINIDNEYSQVSLLTNNTEITLPDPTNTLNLVDRLIVILHQGTGAGIVTNIAWQSTNGVQWHNNDEPNGFNGNITTNQVLYVELWKDELGTGDWLGYYDRHTNA